MSDSDMEERDAEYEIELNRKPTLEEQKNIENIEEFVWNLIKYRNNPKLFAEMWNSLKIKI